MAASLNPHGSVLPTGKVKVQAPPSQNREAPIRVNGVEITLEAIGTEVQHHPADTPDEAFGEAARALVVRELLLQEAAASSLSVVRETLRDGCRETHEDATIRTLIETQISTPRADTASCQRYYDANAQRFCTEPLYEARHILLAAPPSDQAARTQAKNEAEALIAQLRADPSRFAELARVHSACPSREVGGNLGQLGKGSSVAEFETFLFSLEEGQLSPVPVATPFGYHVLQLERIIPGHQQPFEAVHERIAAWLEASSWSQAVSHYIALLAQKAEIHGIEWKTRPANM